MVIDLAIIVLFGFWFAITVLYATPVAKRFAVKRVLLSTSFVPQVKFFAPIPGTHDSHLLYRDQLVDGCLGPWRECLDFTGKRRAAALIWHPEKRAKKTLCDITATSCGESPRPKLDQTFNPPPPSAQLYSRLTSFFAELGSTVCSDRNLCFGS